MKVKSATLQDSQKIQKIQFVVKNIDVFKSVIIQESDAKHAVVTSDSLTDNMYCLLTLENDDKILCKPDSVTKNSPISVSIKSPIPKEKISVSLDTSTRETLEVEHIKPDELKIYRFKLETTEEIYSYSRALYYNGVYYIVLVFKPGSTKYYVLVAFDKNGQILHNKLLVKSQLSDAPSAKLWLIRDCEKGTYLIYVMCESHQYVFRVDDLNQGLSFSADIIPNLTSFDFESKRVTVYKPTTYTPSPDYDVDSILNNTIKFKKQEITDLHVTKDPYYSEDLKRYVFDISDSEYIYTFMVDEEFEILDTVPFAIKLKDSSDIVEFVKYNDFIIIHPNTKVALVKRRKIDESPSEIIVPYSRLSKSCYAFSPEDSTYNISCTVEVSDLAQSTTTVDVPKITLKFDSLKLKSNIVNVGIIESLKSNVIFDPLRPAKPTPINLLFDEVSSNKVKLSSIDDLPLKIGDQFKSDNGTLYTVEKVEQTTSNEYLLEHDLLNQHKFDTQHTTQQLNDKVFIAPHLCYLLDTDKLISITINDHKPNDVRVVGDKICFRYGNYIIVTNETFEPVKAFEADFYGVANDYLVMVSLKHSKVFVYDSNLEFKLAVDAAFPTDDFNNDYSSISMTESSNVIHLHYSHGYRTTLQALILNQNLSEFPVCYFKSYVALDFSDQNKWFIKVDTDKSGYHYQPIMFSESSGYSTSYSSTIKSNRSLLVRKNFVINKYIDSCFSVDKNFNIQPLTVWEYYASKSSLRLNDDRLLTFNGSQATVTQKALPTEWKKSVPTCSLPITSSSSEWMHIYKYTTKTYSSKPDNIEVDVSKFSVSTQNITLIKQPLKTKSVTLNSNLHYDSIVYWIVSADVVLNIENFMKNNGTSNVYTLTRLSNTIQSRFETDDYVTGIFELHGWFS